jgi:hypothetical protein
MNRQPWTDAQLAVLRQFYPDLPAANLAQVLGRPVGSVYQMAAKLGLSKSEAFNQSDASGRTQRGKTNPGMQATQFKPGTAPWNKGKKGSTGLHPNCRATQFTSRKPEQSRNYQPIGSLRITKDGILERKVTDDRNLVPARRWTPVARLVWEAANGKVPPKHIVVFKPGMRTTDPALITLDRLECISRTENAARNHPRNKSPELAKLTQLKGAITRQVNRIVREAQEQRA